MPFPIAIVGSDPVGFYAAEAFIEVAEDFVRATMPKSSREPRKAEANA